MSRSGRMTVGLPSVIFACLALTTAWGDEGMTRIDPSPTGPALPPRARFPQSDEGITFIDPSTLGQWQVRDLIRTSGDMHTRQELLRRGEKAFPEYERVLSDTRADRNEILGVVGIVVQLRDERGAAAHKMFRSRFLEHAVRFLTHPDGGVRGAALGLLRRLGGEGDASPAVALLSDRYEVAYAAAGTLAAIGGRREVVAMDAWLRTGAGCPDLRDQVKKHRDLLKKRLDDLDKKKT